MALPRPPRTLSTLFVLITVLTVGAVLFTTMTLPRPEHSIASASYNLSGFAWSDTLGWISFNDTNCDVDGNGTYAGANEGGGATPAPAGCPTSGAVNPYGVNIRQDGFMEGYAWAPNFGWISFNSSDLGGCPAGTCEARINPATSQLNGWARACSGTVNNNCTGGSRTDGWDGWISLNCLNSGVCATSNYGVAISGCGYSSFAWGGENVGWIRFSGVNGPVSYGVEGNGYACIGPDLTANILPPSSTLIAGTNYTFRGIIYNNGTAAAAATQAQFKIDGVVYGNPSVAALNPGTTQYVDANSWAVASGPHIVELCADTPPQLTNEINTNNNCVTLPFNADAAASLEKPQIRETQ